MFARTACTSNFEALRRPGWNQTGLTTWQFGSVTDRLLVSCRFLNVGFLVNSKSSVSEGSDEPHSNTLRALPRTSPRRSAKVNEAAKWFAQQRAEQAAKWFHTINE